VVLWATPGAGKTFNNTGGALNLTTGIFTVATDGLYFIYASVQFEANATNSRYIEINVNNAAVGLLPASRYQASPNSAVTIAQVYGHVNLVGGDTVRIRVLQDSGGALNVGGSQSDLWMMELVLLP